MCAGLLREGGQAAADGPPAVRAPGGGRAGLPDGRLPHERGREEGHRQRDPGPGAALRGGRAAGRHTRRGGGGTEGGRHQRPEHLRPGARDHAAGGGDRRGHGAGRGGAGGGGVLPAHPGGEQQARGGVPLSRVRPLLQPQDQTQQAPEEPRQAEGDGRHAEAGQDRVAAGNTIQNTLQDIVPNWKIYGK